MQKLTVMTRAFVFLLLGTFLLPVGTVMAQEKKITFSLDFIILGRHAPFFVAVDKGFYKEEGLEVNIIPSQGTAQVIQNTESGIAQLGFVDVASLVVARASGSTVKVVSVLYQKSPLAYLSLDPGANLRSMKDFEGLTVGSTSGSYSTNIAWAMMRKKGLDPSKLKMEAIEPSARVAMFVARKVPAIDSYIMTVPGVSRAVKDAKVVAFLLADHGLDLYSNGIGASEAYLKENPDVVKGFVRATLKGFQYAFKHPEEAAQIIQKHSKALNKDVILEELAIVKDLVVTPDVQKNGIGSFTAERMKSSVDWMVENGGFPKDKAPKVEDVYMTGFMPASPILP